eukprot:6173902-Pleurochrysis_carterae.AAC.3
MKGLQFHLLQSAAVGADPRGRAKGSTAVSRLRPVRTAHDFVRVAMCLLPALSIPLTLVKMLIHQACEARQDSGRGGGRKRGLGGTANITHKAQAGRLR